MASRSCCPRPVTFRSPAICWDTGSSSPAITWLLSPKTANLGWSIICRLIAWRNSAQSAIGSGFLQAYVDDTWVDVARYSNTLAPQFHLFADKLEDLRKSGTVTVSSEEVRDKIHCPRCGLRLAAAGESCPRCLPRKAIAGRLWTLIRPQWPTALGMCVMMLVGVAMELAPPKLQQYLVDGILARGETTPNARSLTTALLLVVLALAGTRVVLSVVNWVKGLMANKVGVELTFELRSQLVRKLHSLGVGYHDRHQVGSLVSRVAYDSEVLHTLLQQITGGFLLQIVQVIAVGGMLFTLNPKLAFYTLIPTPLVVGGSLFSGAAFIQITIGTGIRAAGRRARCRVCWRVFASSRLSRKSHASSSVFTVRAIICDDRG